jgi:hypothetical protein
MEEDLNPDFIMTLSRMAKRYLDFELVLSLPIVGLHLFQLSHNAEVLHLNMAITCGRILPPLHCRISDSHDKDREIQQDLHAWFTLQSRYR